jgi:tetratricopeptide (TPR) repeat protein
VNISSTLRAALALLAMGAPGCAPAEPQAFDPRSIEASMPDVLAALREGDPQRALQALDDLEQTGEAPPGFEHYRGMGLADLGRTEQALAAYEREIVTHPGNGRAHGMAAEALLELGRPLEAKAHLAQCRRFARDFPFGALLTGRAALQTDDDRTAAEAFRLYLSVDKLSPRAAEAQHALARIATRAGQSERAAQHEFMSQQLEKINQFGQRYGDRIAADPDDQAARLGLGMIALEIFREIEADGRHLEAAEQHLGAVLAAEPRNLKALLNMGFVRLAQGRPEQALPLYAEVTSLAPDHVAGRLNHGALARQLGRLQEAQVQLDAGLALAREADDIERALYERARLDEDLGRPDEARRTYARFLALPPAQPRDAAQRMARLQDR